MDEFMTMALDIVKAQAGVRSMTEEEISSMILSISKCLKQLSTGETADAAPQPASSFGTPEKSITEKSVTCLECGKTFKVLTKKHLGTHDLTAEEYKSKWGMPKKTALVCKSLQRERRKKMKNMKIWEKRTTPSAAEASVTVAPSKSTSAKTK